jgi:hypothetical protein
MSTLEKFKRRVEGFLSRNEMAASRFGQLACNDPNFVLDLRRGRKPNPNLMDRVDRFMADAESSAGEAA